MADPERGLWERSNFKELPQFLKSDRISLAYGLTSNKDQTFINKSCFVFFLYRGICRFCAIFGRFGGMTALNLFGSGFEGHGSPPPANRYMCIPPEFKRRCLNRLFPKSACKFPHTWANYITDSNKMFRSRSRGSLIGSNSDSDSLLVATTPGDSNSDSGSAPLLPTFFAQLNIAFTIGHERSNSTKRRTPPEIAIILETK